MTLDTVSGHDYTLAPEPARALLLAVAALLVPLRARSAGSRRARRQAASRAPAE